MNGYDGSTCLVTGANGFMGSHLCEQLKLSGARVIASVRATSSGEQSNLRQLQVPVDGVHFGDLTDKRSADDLVSLLRGTEPYVFHFAAQAHVGDSWVRPYETLMINTIGTLNLLQSLVDLGVRPTKIDVAGTSEEYGNVDPTLRDRYRMDEDGVVFDERSPLNPKSPYAVSKLAAEYLGRSYHDAYDLPVVVARMFNNYGPRQSPTYFTGTVITQALSGPVVRLGNLDSRRDFLYTVDGARGHMALGLHGRPGEAYCFGSGTNVSMREWAELILRVGADEGYWGDDVAIEQSPDRFRPGRTDVDGLKADSSKLTADTGWRPLVGVRQGLARTIEWYAGNRSSWLGRTPATMAVG